jgi:large subunit ribosomal protein L4
MESVIYDQKGKEAGKVMLPKIIFDLPMNGDLVHQVFSSLISNKRAGTAVAKDRSAVRGGGKKPWAQKGTGRARHGSSRSPIWRGGGVTFGPTAEKNYDKKINKKMNIKALYTVLAQKERDGEILFVDKFDFKEAKTKDAKVVLSDLSKIKGFENLLSKKNNSAHIAFGESNPVALKSFGNFNNLDLDKIEHLNLLDLLNYKYLVITHPEKSLEFLVNKTK